MGRNRRLARTAGSLFLILMLMLVAVPNALASPPDSERIVVDDVIFVELITAPESACGYSGVIVGKQSGELRRSASDRGNPATGARFKGNVTGEFTFVTDQGPRFVGEFKADFTAHDKKPTFVFHATALAEDGTRLRLRITGQLGESPDGETLISFADVACNGHPPNLSCPDAALEPDDSPAEATPYDASTNRHAFCTPGDEDWISFVGESGSSHTILADRLTRGTRVVIEVYDAAGALLKSSDSGRLLFSPSTSGTYYVRTYHTNGQSSVAYTYRLAIFEDLFSSFTDLEITKIDVPDPVLIGEELIYVLVIMNRGPETANGWGIGDVLPEGVEFVSVSTTRGECFTGGIGSVEGVDCFGVSSGFDLPSGDIIIVTIAVEAPSTTGVLSNRAIIGTSSPFRDLFEDNNEVIEETTVIAP